MYDEKSCGAVTCTIKNNKAYYVLVQNLDGIYGFPKGHVENDESETETAYREVYEEVHLKPTFMDGFKETDQYELTVNGKRISKLVVYYLGIFDHQKIIKQDIEVIHAPLVSYEEAMQLIQVESTRQILNKANNFLIKKGVIR